MSDSCSATPSSYKGEEISRLSRLIIEIPILGHLGVRGGIRGICSAKYDVRFLFGDPNFLYRCQNFAPLPRNFPDLTWGRQTERHGDRMIFYRAMHFSAFARSCDRMSSVRLSVCPSVRLSVTLVICDHIDWKSWKLIAWAISPTSSLFAAKRRSTYSQGNMEKFWGD